MDFHVYVVTTLAALGNGSLIEGLSYNGDEERWIVFDVAGSITLDADSCLLDAEPRNIRVFGNTSPGGVRITGHPFYLKNAENVHFYHVAWHLQAQRNRRMVKSWSPIRVISTAEHQTRTVSFTHCSIYGGQDENGVTPLNSREHDPEAYASDGVLFDRCLFGPSWYLHRGYHNHHLMFSHARNAVVRDCFFAHANRRCPQLHGDRCTSLNNVVYNYGTMATGVMGGGSYDVIRNLYIPGLNSRRKPPVFPVTTQPAQEGTVRLYLGRNMRLKYESIPFSSERLYANESPETASVEMQDEPQFNVPESGWSWNQVIDEAGTIFNDRWDQMMRKQVRGRRKARNGGWWCRTEWAIDGMPHYPEHTRTLEVPDMPRDELLSWLLSYSSSNEETADAP